jgi:septum formation protein
MSEKLPVILASGSKARRVMLEGAGIKFTAETSSVDEQKILDNIPDIDMTNTRRARILACAKALDIAARHPGALVIGADQILELDGIIMVKATSAEEAKENFKTMRGKVHTLISAVCVARGKEILWEYAEQASLAMREFDDIFLDRYCEQAGEALTYCVGGYKLESLGAQLFANVQGDYFTILGMPLLPLLKYLHDEHGISL